MSFQILIATYGNSEWATMAVERALPSALAQGADLVSIDHYPNASIAEARNMLGEQAQCDWLVFLDADDELEPGYIDAMRRVVAGANFHEGKHILLMPRVSYIYRGHKRPARFLKQTNLQDDNYLIVGTGIQRSLFEQVGGFGDYPHGFEDWSLWAKAWRAGARVVEIPGAVYIAYVNENSKHRTMWRDREAQVAMHECVRRELFPELYA